MRRFLVSLRDRLDEKLHPRRLRRARKRLHDITPSSVLFVCLGNICRSPYAERVLDKRRSAPMRASSAGFIRPGRPPPEEALMVARARGVEHGDHVSRLLTPELAQSSDVIFAFDRHNARQLRGTPGVSPERVFWLGDFDPEWAGRRAIPDPWGKPLQEFGRTFARIERCVDEVARVLAQTGVERP